MVTAVIEVRLPSRLAVSSQCKANNHARHLFLILRDRRNWIVIGSPYLRMDPSFSWLHWSSNESPVDMAAGFEDMARWSCSQMSAWHGAAESCGGPMVEYGKPVWASSTGAKVNFQGTAISPQAKIRFGASKFRRPRWFGWITACGLFPKNWLESFRSPKAREWTYDAFSVLRWIRYRPVI